MPLAPFFLIALALVGIGDTLYLSYYQYYNLLPTCQLGGCETVLTSAYSKFFGVPWSYIGLIYYAYLLGLGALLAFDPHSRGLRWGALLYTGIGVAYSAWAILYIQATVLQAICEFCAISAGVAACAFGVAVWHQRSTRAHAAVETP